MKKYIFWVLVYLPLSSVYAQSGDSKLFFKVFGNYAIPTSGSFRNSDYTTSIKNHDYSYSSIKDGLGMGLRAGVGIGVVLNDFINLGLDGEKYFGNSIKSNTLVYDDNNSGLIRITNTNVDYQANILMLSPNITFKALSQTNFFVYNRLSIKVGINTKVTEKHNIELNERFVEDSNINPNMTDHITNTKQEFEYQGGLPFGFSTALGFQVKMTDKVRFFAELEFTQLTYNPKKKVMTRWEDYKGKVVDMTTIDKIMIETEYVDSYTVLDGKTNTKAPMQQPALRMPFSSIGLGVGFIYKL